MISIDSNINKAKNWQLLCFAANNGSNVIGYTLVIVKYFAIFTELALGINPFIIGIIIFVMRLMDGLIAPFIGNLLDKTDTRIGRFRPYIIVGNALTVVSMFLIFFTNPEWNYGFKLIWVIIFNFLFTVGFTMQTGVTKSGLAIMTNDPKQRPLYGIFDSIFAGIGGGLLPFAVGIFAAHYIREFAEPMVWRWVVIIFCPLSIIFAITAYIGMREKDQKEFYNKSDNYQLNMIDVFRLLKTNKPIRMLILAAATDKLAYALRMLTSVYFFTYIFLNQKFDSNFALYSGIPMAIVLFWGLSVARTKGMKKIFTDATVVSTIFVLAITLLMPFLVPQGGIIEGQITAGMIIIYVLFCLQMAVANLSGALVQPMISDCTDYELLTSGRFVPGMMGSLFSFADKAVSSFAGLILAVSMALAGFGFSGNLKNLEIVDNGVTYIGEEAVRLIKGSANFYWAMLFCVLIVPLIGHICSLYAMKGYELSAKRMEEIQLAISKVKE